MNDRIQAPLLSLCALILFWAAVALQSNTTRRLERPAEVFIEGPVQVFLYGGDRFLAANIESIRAATSATATGAEHFRLRAHQGVSRLNPCHEDNYWIGNASLSWGGAVDGGFTVLFNAMHCRYWDEWPAFFYGFNKHFFQGDVKDARRVLELAAQRSPHNTAAYRNYSIMLAAGEIDDARLAVEMLKHEQNQASDPDLREMLGKRVGRLQGLVILRDAQNTFEKRFGPPLESPSELLNKGVLSRIPEDPLGIGYEFRDHAFHLREIEIK